jgi:hypothetical protein
VGLSNSLCSEGEEIIMRWSRVFLSIVLLLGIAACSGVQPAAVPTSTPDAIATGVAQARAIAATLTAGVPTATLTPVPTATSTLSPTDTLTLTPTPDSQEQELLPTPTYVATVFGEVYGIEVVSVGKADSYFDNVGGLVQMVQPETGNVFLVVGFWLYKDGKFLEENQELSELSVMDSNGEVYKRVDAGIIYSVYTDKDGKNFAKSLIVRFSVPKDATGFRLRYRDLPLIDLGL